MLAQAHDSTDRGPRQAASERLCLATRSVRATAEMIRFVAAPDGEVVPDLKRRLPGRGVWVTGTREAVAAAVRASAFRRGLRDNVRVPADLADRVDERLLQSALDALSVAHKAGRIVLGFSRVCAVAGTGEAVAFIHAAEAGADGVEKIARAQAGRTSSDRVEIAHVRAFTTPQLDLALGRSNVVHAALLAGPASDTFVMRWRNLVRYRTGPASGVATGPSSSAE